MSERSQVIRLKPFNYIHVLDNNTNVARVEVGPKTATILDHETVVQSATPMIMIPPRHYCIISNPAMRDPKTNNLIKDEHGQVRLRHGDEEIRQTSQPFPLYPGEKLYGKVTPLQVVAPLTALKLRAVRDFKEGTSTYTAGDEWLFKGPGTYLPRVEVQVVEIVRANVIGLNEALRLRAKKEFTGADGVARKTSEEWLVRAEGAYLPDVFEEVVQLIQAVILTDRKALHLRASRTFNDAYGIERKAGEEWLVTKAQSERHIPDIYEVVVGEVSITTLNSRQYCVVLDPVNAQTGKQSLGTRELRKGDVSFFLKPGERLESGIQNVHVLESHEALLLRAREEFLDASENKKRAPGDRWMIYGPTDYTPTVEVEILEKRKNIPLDTNEGVYVREMTSGRVRSVIGSVYMLSPYEELWEKELPAVVEELLPKDADQSSDIKSGNASVARDKTKVVSYRIPHNSCVQVYDYKAKKARVIFGPDLIMLGPEEQFTVLSLSGNTPKEPNKLNVIALLLGPRFSTDVVVVETSDHARLSLKLSYSWFFDFDRSNQESATKLFSVPDFIGDFCKAIASRVRGHVAQQSFDNFHKSSADIIHRAVFGDGKNRFHMKSNNLVINNIDIQSVEPVDSRTRDALQKSIQLAIEITTSSQEATARHEAGRREQQARGRLDRQKIEDEAEAEKARRSLLQLQAASAAVESTGQATAEAKARAESAKIEGEAGVVMAGLRAKAQAVRSETALKTMKIEQESDLAYKKAKIALEVKKAQELAEIESLKFKKIVDAIGPQTLKNISRAGPEMQVRLLSGLGLQSFMITDGSRPINLFNTAQGLIGNSSQ